MQSPYDAYPLFRLKAQISGFNFANSTTQQHQEQQAANSSSKQQLQKRQSEALRREPGPQRRPRAPQVLLQSLDTSAGHCGESQAPGGNHARRSPFCSLWTLRRESGPQRTCAGHCGESRAPSSDQARQPLVQSPERAAVSESSEWSGVEWSGVEGRMRAGWQPTKLEPHTEMWIFFNSCL